ncbi:hypothetical protein L1987_26966 [Smallanthus sonchifolius]|uniref:Uncharacterized protein n=1 Tax=Smallanthus sonchifolius TaxID=185202 RepID=A0ACB9I9S2_9ASTR|nr:hypothetical protein L1987_26966 [Smallanthus sonchifolius]
MQTKEWRTLDGSQWASRSAYGMVAPGRHEAEKTKLTGQKVLSLRHLQTTRLMPACGKGMQGFAEQMIYGGKDYDLELGFFLLLPHNITNHLQCSNRR